MRDPIAPVSAKACSKCGAIKLPADFNKSPTTRDHLTSWCKACTNALSKRIRRERKELYAQHMRNWRAQNPERNRENWERWQRENIEKVRESRRKSERNRNQRKRAMDGSTGYIDALVVLERHDGVCGICGEDVDPLAFEVDHAIPLSRGGAHAYWNCYPAHPACNNSKHNLMPWELADRERCIA